MATPSPLSLTLTLPLPLTRTRTRTLSKEQHAYLTHIVRNYDSLADRTVFMHGREPSCGFFLVDPNNEGNHLLTNVSVLDYLLSEGDLYKGRECRRVILVEAGKPVRDATPEGRI